MNNRHSAGVFTLFLAFLRLGLTAFGGPAMVAYIRKLAVQEKGWLSESSFKKGVAICQTIPGATAMQAAAYAGLRAGGPWGAVAAYAGFGIPAFFLMVALSAVYQQTHDLPTIISLFAGLQVIVVALIANATLSFGRSYIKTWQDALLGLLAAGFLVLGGSPMIAISSSAGLGIVLYKKIYAKKEGKQKKITQEKHWKLIQPACFLMLVTGTFLFILFFVQRDLFSLATLMLKIDCFAFGGGYASVPLMFHEIVEVKQWMSNQALMDGIALGQVTPGPIVITATFAGYLLAGIPGALVGTVSIFTPSLFLLLLVVPYFDRLEQNVFVQAALRGILVSFVGLLLAVTIRFSLAAHWTLLSIGIAACAFTALYLKINILWVVLIGAGISAFLL